MTSFKRQFLFLTFLISWSSVFAIKKIDNNFASILIIIFWYMPGPMIATIIMERFNIKKIVEYFNFKNLNVRHLFIPPLISCLFSITFLFIIFLGGNLLNIENFGTISLDRKDIIDNILKLSTNSDAKKINLPKNMLMLPFFILIFGSFIGAVVNFPFALGEELGWRGYLLKETKEYHFLHKIFYIGFFWGMWHLPLIIIGLNFGENYFLGLFLMIIFCIISSILFVGLAIKYKSVIYPTLLHGSINATVPGLIFLIKGGNNLFSSPVGVLGIISMIITILLTFFSRCLLKKTFF